MKSGSEVTQTCPTLSDPMDCSLPGSSVHRIFQARVLECSPPSRSGNLCTPMADSCWCMAKPIQYCKVKKIIIKLEEKKKVPEWVAIAFSGQEEQWGLKAGRVGLLNQGILSTMSSSSPEHTEPCLIILLCSLSLGRKLKNSSLEIRPWHTDLRKLLVKSLPHSLFSLLNSWRSPLSPN